MRLSEFVVRDAIIPQMAASTKEGVIREMIASLHAAGQFPNADLDDIVRAILKREELGSTGIGRGVAIPHAKHTCADKLTGTIALSPKGVDFKSLDGEKAYVFVLLISPQDRPGDHLPRWKTSPAASAMTVSSRHCASAPRARTCARCSTGSTTRRLELPCSSLSLVGWVESLRPTGIARWVSKTRPTSQAPHVCEIIP